MIETVELTKRYGRRTAVDALSFSVPAGQVVGFLGPNGAGKSTTMRLILGLDRIDAGTALIGGLPYRAHARPLRQVGALLEQRALHPGRTARHHLLWLAQSNGIARARIDAVLDLVGLADVAGRRVRTFSLGMAQRLGMAAALLGDPAALVLDEPMNGLDPEGMVWLRGLLRDLAGEGRAVLVSSHLMAEMEHLADRLVLVNAGRLVAAGTPDDLRAGHGSLETAFLDLIRTDSRRTA